MTIDEALRAGMARLRAAGIAAGDAQPLLADVLEVERGRLILLGRDDVSGSDYKVFEGFLERRCAGEPVAKIIGRRAFWGRYFRVTADVLDPRPETEILIAAALEAEAGRLCDLGTGTGIIALTLLAEWPGARAVASDASAPALAVAARNAEALGVSGRVAFKQADWWDGIEGRFDLIVSNPPYVARAEMDDLAREVREHDPEMALTDGGDGLSAYRAICAGVGAHLAPGGRLMVEIGPSQGAAVAEMFAAAGLQEVAIRQDFDARDRVVIGRAE